MGLFSKSFFWERCVLCSQIEEISEKKLCASIAARDQTPTIEKKRADRRAYENISTRCPQSRRFVGCTPCFPPCIYIIVSLGWHRLCKRLYIYIGVGVDWLLRFKTCQPLRELDNQGTIFVFLVFFLAVTMMVTELYHIVRGGEP